LLAPLKKDEDSLFRCEEFCETSNETDGRLPKHSCSRQRGTAKVQDVVGKLWSVCGCPDEVNWKVWIDHDGGPLEENFVQVGWMGCAHKSQLFRELNDGLTSLPPDLLTLRMGGIQVMKFIYEDGLDAAA
jgi:hypothetical protein